MNNKKVVLALASLIGLFICTLVALVLWAMKLDSVIKEKLAGQRWASPTDYYAAPQKFVKNQIVAPQVFEDLLLRLDYNHVPPEQQNILPGQYSKLDKNICAQRLSQGLPERPQVCYLIHPRYAAQTFFVLVNEGFVLEGIFSLDGVNLTAVDRFKLDPELFAQFYGGQPVLRKIIRLGDAPSDLLNAVMSIEDSHFLEHKGVSVTGIGRAIIKNIFAGGAQQGGSTLTQQLIKNYFLTPEKTIKRKITEIVMAILLESRVSKDDILETYLNEIYLGQAGPFEIHGMASASEYYFAKKVRDLNLVECAMLAGLIQSPNRLNPTRHPQKALDRRKQVLSRMLSLNMISQAEFQDAANAPLPSDVNKVLKDQAPYYVDAVQNELKQQGIADFGGLKVYTNLNLPAQKAATKAIAEGLAQIEKENPFITKLEEKLQTRLQALLVSSDPTTGHIQAVVGGSDFQETQLNRVVQSKRQVGSIFKPFVYLTALQSNDRDGVPYTPLTRILDAPFTMKVNKQDWSPQNYDNEYFGDIALYQALEKSLNAATVKLSNQVGVENVVKTALAAGVATELPAVFSLALGSIELSPLEALESYNTFATMGEHRNLSTLSRVEDLTGSVLFQNKNESSRALDAATTAQLVWMMKGTILRGTARGVRALGFNLPAAGKTGTTNDKKDAWFSGFTPDHSALVWVGFDQPEKTNLTGARAAVPIWTRYMKEISWQLSGADFAIPEGVRRIWVDPETGSPLSFEQAGATEMLIKN